MRLREAKGITRDEVDSGSVDTVGVDPDTAHGQLVSKELMLFPDQNDGGFDSNTEPDCGEIK